MYPLFAAELTDTPIWQSVVTPIGRALGVIFVLFGIINTVRQLASGKTTGAVKVAAITVIGAAFLFNPAIIQQILEVGASIVKTVIDSISSLVGGGGGSTGGGGGTAPA
jgi:hypothetical protein